MSAIVVKPAINNVFTPNGDGKNDTWVINNLELFKENELFVYNRWGNEVYTTKNYRNNWDGSDLTEGTYFYILKVKDCEQWFEFNGYVTILR
jgi:gliding motility-associated-like protein